MAFPCVSRGAQAAAVGERQQSVTKRIVAVHRDCGRVRVTDPIALLRALAGVLAPGGEVVLETLGSRLAIGAPAIEVHEAGDVYARDEFVYWGFSPEGLRRLARIVGLEEAEVVDGLEIDGHTRILALLRAAG